MFGADGPQVLALEVSLPVIEAEQELKGPVSDARLYDVVLAATGDEDVAWEARSARIADRLRNREPVEV